jgi:hypothetical protein
LKQYQRVWSPSPTKSSTSKFTTDRKKSPKSNQQSIRDLFDSPVKKYSDYDEVEVEENDHQQSIRKLFDSPVKKYSEFDEFGVEENDYDQVEENNHGDENEIDKEEFEFVNLNNDPRARAQFEQIAGNVVGMGSKSWMNQKPTVKEFKPKQKRWNKRSFKKRK